MKLSSLLSVFFIIILVIFSCKKDPESPSGNKIEIDQTTTDNLSFTEVEATTTVNSLGGNSITQHGHCWSTESDPTIQDSKTSLGELNQPKTYTSEITDLLDNTTYYIRSYLTYSTETIYGDEQSVTTLKLGKPTVSTDMVSEITLSSAQCGGIVIADSGLQILSRGVCWDTVVSFNIQSNIGYTSDGDSLGAFVSEIIGLNEGINYYAKAYATNEKGTGYGEIEEFSTVAIILPTVSTIVISGITTTTVTSGGEVTNNGNGNVTERGVCWSTDANPTIQNNLGFTDEGSGLGSFTSNIIGLTENTTYFIAAYVTNEKGTAYGEVKEFSTLPIMLPTVITDEVTNITAVSATCGGNVTNDGNSEVLTKGICWNNTGNPSIENHDGLTTDGSGIGSFISNLNNLQDGIDYFVRSYATNDKGIAYGEVKQFITLTLEFPLVSTTEVSNITVNSVEVGGDVLSDGNGTISERGVCWNTTGNPILENCLGYTNDGVGTGIFISNITGLNEGVLYYYAAYAINQKGAAYGEDRLFETLDLTPCDGQVSFNYDGQTYATVEIGYQCWMKGNLNMGMYIHGSTEQQDNQIIEKYCYNNNLSNCEVYGGLYQWNELMNYNSTPAGQGICSEGWHVPTQEEQSVLIEFLGGTDFAGGKMKETGTLHWHTPNTGATNSSGFTGLPGGYSYPGGWVGLYDYGNFWSSTMDASSTAMQFSLWYTNENAYQTSKPKTTGYSVRCLKD